MLMAGLVAAGLVGLYVVTILLPPVQTPLVLVRATRYPLQLPPLAFGQEDAQIIADANAENIRVVGGPGPLLVSNSDAALQAFAEKLAAAGDKQRWRQYNVVLVYIAAHGWLNERREPCLVLPNSDLFDSSTWLPLAKLFEALRQEKRIAARKKVVFLDCQRTASCWRAGWLENRFGEELPAAVAKANDPNLYVITSAGPGEIAWAAPEMRGSIFGHFVAQALQGQGRWNWSIPLDSLFADVSQHVNEYSQKRHGLPQHPQLLHKSGPWKVDGNGRLVSAAEGAPVAAEADLNFGLAYPNRWWSKNRSVDALAAAHPDPVAKALELFFGPAAATGARPQQRADRTLSALWEEYQKLRKRTLESGEPPPYSTNPVVWAEVQQLLAAIGERLVAGEEYQQSLTSDMEAVKEKLRTSANWAPEGNPAKLNRLLAARDSDSAASPTGDNVFAAWLKSKDDPEKKQPIPRSTSEVRLVRDIYEVLTKQPENVRQVLEEGRVQLQEWRRGGVSAPPLIESHFLALLDAGLPTGELFAPDVFVKSLLTREAAERAATPPDMRVHYALERLVNEADEKRRAAEDALYLSIRADEAHQRFTDAQGAPRQRAGYFAAETLGKNLAAAYRLRDEIWADLPLLAEWQLKQPASTRPTSAMDSLLQLLEPYRGTAQPGSVTPGVMSLDKALEDALVARDSAEPDDDQWRRVEQIYETVRRNWELVVTDFHKNYQVSVKDEFPAETFRQAEMLLGWPPLGVTSFDDVVNKYLQELTGPQQRRSLPASAAAQANSLSRDMLRELHRVLDFRFVGPAYNEHRHALAWDGAEKTPDEIFRTKQEQQDEAAFTRIQTALNIYNKDLNDERLWNENQRALDAARKLREWDKRVRLASPWLHAFKGPTPARRLQQFDAAHLTAWHAYRALEDYWGTGQPNNSQSENYADSPPPFFATAVERAKPAFQQVKIGTQGLKYDVPGGGMADFSAADTKALQALYNWRGIDAVRSSPGGGANGPASMQISPLPALREDGKLLAMPKGEAAVAVVGADGKTPLAGAQFGTNTRPVEAVAIPIEQTPAQPLRVSFRDNSQGTPATNVSARLWYRGHVRGDLKIGPEQRTIEYTVVQPKYNPPKVQVNGEDTMRGTVLFVFDCSASMREGPAGGTRFDVAQQQLISVLTDARAGAETLKVGLMLYGHRTPVETKLYDRSKTFEDQPPNLAQPHPDDDCELIVSPGKGSVTEVLRRVQALRVGQCVGATPLYRSIAKAIEVVANEPGVSQIVVISDGVNMPWNVGKPTDPATGKARAGANYEWGPIIKGGRQFLGDIVDEGDYRQLKSALQQNATSVNVTVHLFGQFTTPFENQTQIPRLQALARDYRNFKVRRLQLANLIADSIWNAFPNTDVDLRREPSSGDPQKLDFGQTTEIAGWRADGQLQKYVARVKAPGERQPAERELQLLGGEKIVLEYSASGQVAELTFASELFRPLFSQRVTRGPRPMWVDVGQPEKSPGGVSKLFFRLRDDDDKRRFTPRPKYVWLEVSPIISAGAAAPAIFPMIDPVWKEHTNLPLLEMPVKDWPRDSRSAKVKFWFRTSDPPNMRTERLSARNTDVTLDRREPETWRVTQSGGMDEGERRITVTCRSDSGTPSLDAMLGWAVWIWPPPSTTHRRYDQSGVSAEHTFTYDRGDVSNVELRIVKREDFVTDAQQADFDFNFQD